MILLHKLRKKNKLFWIILASMIALLALGTTLLIVRETDKNISGSMLPDNQQIVEDTVVDETNSDEQENPKVAESPAEQKPEPQPAPPPQWPKVLSNAQASSMTVVVNKKHKLPSSYVPAIVSVAGGSLRAEAATALEKLLADAEDANRSMKLISSYRSYSTQASTYAKWVNQSGQGAADTFSARAGHSEHQLGLAADLGEAGNSACDLETCFGETAAGTWLSANAPSYGFIIRYPQGKQSITGYQYEPWHIRYVGLTAAQAITASGQTMDEYYGVPAGDYN